MKLQIELSKKQLSGIAKALDLYSRILCGQLEEIPTVIQRADFTNHVIDTNDKRFALDTAIRHLKSILFPEIAPASYGIYAEGVLPETAAITYDIYQVIEKLNNDKEIFKTSNKEEIPIIEIIEA